MLMVPLFNCDNKIARLLFLSLVDHMVFDLKLKVKKHNLNGEIMSKCLKIISRNWSCMNKFVMFLKSYGVLEFWVQECLEFGNF